MLRLLDGVINAERTIATWATAQHAQATQKMAVASVRDMT